MYLLYKNKYGLLAGFIGLFETSNEVELYIMNNPNSNFTYRVEFVEKIGVSEINGI